MAATAGELQEAVVATLKKSQTYEEMECEVRQCILDLLQNRKVEREKRDNEKFIINELIREYLKFNCYSNSLSVFTRETGQTNEPMDRDFIGQKLHCVVHKHIPILYSLTALINSTEEKPDKEVQLDSDEDCAVFEIKSRI